MSGGNNNFLMDADFFLDPKVVRLRISAQKEGFNGHEWCYCFFCVVALMRKTPDLRLPGGDLSAEAMLIGIENERLALILEHCCRYGLLETEEEDGFPFYFSPSLRKRIATYEARKKAGSVGADRRWPGGQQNFAIANAMANAMAKPIAKGIAKGIGIPNSKRNIIKSNLTEENLRVEPPEGGSEDLGSPKNTSDERKFSLVAVEKKDGLDRSEVPNEKNDSRPVSVRNSDASKNEKKEVPGSVEDFAIANAIAKPIANAMAKPIAKPIANAMAKPIAKPIANAMANAIAKPIANAIAKPIANSEDVSLPEDLHRQDPWVEVAEDFLESPGAGQDWEQSTAWLCAGRRPLKKYPDLWLSLPELVDVLKGLSQSLPQDRFAAVFKRANAQAADHLAAGKPPSAIKAYAWLTSWAKQTEVDDYAKSLRLEREKINLDNARQRGK